MGNRTFAMIKPDATGQGFTHKILDRITAAGFIVLGSKLIRMSKSQAEGFYTVHRGKPFFEELTNFMSSGQTMVLALEKENAVEAWRETIGNTDPEKAAEGTIRKDFATSLSKNAVHGADSDENAELEIHFFFNETELINSE